MHGISWECGTVVNRVGVGFRGGYETGPVRTWVLVKGYTVRLSRVIICSKSLLLLLSVLLYLDCCLGVQILPKFCCWDNVMALIIVSKMGSLIKIWLVIYHTFCGNFCRWLREKAFKMDEICIANSQRIKIFKIPAYLLYRDMQWILWLSFIIICQVVS